MKAKYGIVLTIVLLLQSAGYYAAELRKEKVPPVRPLQEFPVLVNGWLTVQDTPLEKEIQDVLRADDTLNRTYASPDRSIAANLFMAFFRTQRTGQSPHSPKNCLPGSGWEPSETGFLTVDLPGSGHAPITINRYIVSRGEQRSAVLYWYQSHNRVIASEVAAKVWLVADSVRYHRSDTALVRVVVPVRGNDDAEAVAAGVRFVRDLFPAIEKQLPS
jgi:EpsI family protein